MNYVIRMLTGADAEIFRAVRLESLERHFEAFGASFEEESAMSLAKFATRLDQGTIFGGFEAEDLVGVVGFRTFDSRKTRHRGVLWGLYAKPNARGRGLVGALIETMLQHAKSKVELVQLTVETTNRPAVQLYRKMGFEQYGLERRALKVGDRYLDETLLVRFFD